MIKKNIICMVKTEHELLLMLISTVIFNRYHNEDQFTQHSLINNGLFIHNHGLKNIYRESKNI